MPYQTLFRRRIQLEGVGGGSVDEVGVLICVGGKRSSTNSSIFASSVGGISVIFLLRGWWSGGCFSRAEIASENDVLFLGTF
jgi:hypothetical protein